jgi:hypothetical protein
MTGRDTELDDVGGAISDGASDTAADLKRNWPRRSLAGA